MTTNRSSASVFPPRGRKPLIKWVGGKERELKHIGPHLPAQMERYFDPFVGGGAVWMAIDAQQCLVNDLSSHLFQLYQHIATAQPLFYVYATAIDAAWLQAESFCQKHGELLEMYHRYRADKITQAAVREQLRLFCERHKQELDQLLMPQLFPLPQPFSTEAFAQFFKGMVRMKEIDIVRRQVGQANLPFDYAGMIESLLKGAVYYALRALFNLPSIKASNPPLHAALFLFVRNYAYGGAFRCNKRGELNVAYGGLTYNSKTLGKKLAYYKSDVVRKQLAKTQIFNLDFEAFLEKNKPTERDFIFVDPPYDTIGSTYDNNIFSRKDHQRLADYLFERCSARWMLVIKNTSFVYNLYNREGVHIRSFEKQYSVNFKNRNDKKTTHLLITNYESNPA